MQAKVNEETVKSANEESVARLIDADPALVDVVPAREVISGMAERTILHSGPPISWEEMADTQKGAVLGAMVFEGIANSVEEARELAEHGEIELGSAQDHAAAGPGTGAISASMAVFVIENRAYGNRAACPLQDIHFAFGANDDGTIGRLRWLSDVLGPAIGEATRRIGGIELMPIAETALKMGDECHDRVIASSALFTRQLVPHIVRLKLKEDVLLEILDYLATDIMADWTFESPWIGACRVMLDAAHGVEHSSIVTTMSGNGATFGIRVSGLGDDWFVASAPAIIGAFFEPYSAADALGEMGDSVAIDTYGCGGPALAASPAHMPLTGKRPEDGVRMTKRMYGITTARHPKLTIPFLDFSGIPIGIDIRKVVETDAMPIMAVGIGHKTPGIGFIGLGIAEAPRDCFLKAVAAFSQRYGD